jgi:predicted GIY-YIG superfamily endonuclease
MTKVTATKDAHRFVVQFEDGKTYTAVVAQVGNRLEAHYATSLSSPSNTKAYSLDRNAKLLARISEAINA